jgi:hypothetical protein
VFEANLAKRSEVGAACSARGDVRAGRDGGPALIEAVFAVA